MSDTRTKTTTVPALIAGERIDDQEWFELLRPGSQEVVAEIVGATAADVDAAVRAATSALDEMAALPVHRRQSILRRAADLLREGRDELAAAIADETGKTLQDALGEMDRAWEATAFAADACTREIGEVLPANTVPHGEGRLCFTVRVPIGVIAAITPFNAPVSVGCHKIAPAIAAGNTIVLKPSPNGSVSSLRLVELFHEAGLPAAALNLVHGGAGVGEALVTHADVDLINFTGGGKTADAIIRQAGMKRTVLELGGNGATLIHDDANLSQALPACSVAAFGLSGQSCVSLQRIYAQEAVYQDVVDGMVEAAEELVVGDPRDPDTDVGPLISPAAAERIEGWLQQAVEGGARVLCGGGRDGSYIEPTVVVDVDPDMDLVCDEVFGPVVSVLPYADVDDAIAQINDSPWGLQAGVFTASLDLMLELVRAVKVGGLMVNAPNRFRVENMPYGGQKQSGWGREGAKYAIEDMTELRSVLVGPSG